MIIIYLVWILSTRINEQKIVFMPPKVITQEMWVKGNEVSKSYLQDMGQFIASNLLNITKDNAKNNVDNIMHLIEPQFYNKVRTELIAQTEYIINNSISRTFLTAIEASFAIPAIALNIVFMFVRILTLSSSSKNSL